MVYLLGGVFRNFDVWKDTEKDFKHRASPSHYDQLPNSIPDLWKSHGKDLPKIARELHRCCLLQKLTRFQTIESVAAQHPRNQCPSGRVLKAKEPVKRVAGGETIGRRKWGDTQWHDQLQGGSGGWSKSGVPRFHPISTHWIIVLPLFWWLDQLYPISPWFPRHLETENFSSKIQPTKQQLNDHDVKLRKAG